MAKRRKEKDEEEETDFKLPKFDEKAFIVKEKEKIRATILSFIFGIIISIITYGFWILLVNSPFQWTLVFLFGLFNASWLRYLFARFHIDESILERKGQFFSYAIYFLTWLFVLIVLVNPPFYDGEAPNIDAVSLPMVQELGGTVKIIAHVTDNSDIKDNEITFTLSYNNTDIEEETIPLDQHMFTYEFVNEENNLGTYNYIIKAEDNSGKTTTYNGTFTYDTNALSITSSRFDDIRSGDTIVISANEHIFPNNFRVYYTIDKGSEINVNRDTKENKERYETSAEYIGWKENKNHTINVYAEVIQYFANNPKKYNNTIKDSTSYTFTTGEDNNIGTKSPPISYNCTRNKQKQNTINYKLPCPTTITVPGFEVFLALVSLLVGVLFFKYKKKHQH